MANTPSDSVDVIDAKTRKVIRRIPVGIDPVSLALRPDGRELWVANHVSDSVSVIDTNLESRTYLRVVDTVQDLICEPKPPALMNRSALPLPTTRKRTLLFPQKNKIAIIDVRSRKVRRHLNITAQDPRAIVVRNGKLYVIPFESNNKTQLSGGYKIDGKLVTFNAHEHSIANNNVLSLGHKTDIVKHPRVPDRDLYVFNTKTDQLVKTVSTLGTLLYGLAVDSEGTVFIAQTDARNEVNGRSGTKKHGLKELENRAFLNQITRVSFREMTLRNLSSSTLSRFRPSSQSVRMRWLHHSPFRSATMTKRFMLQPPARINFSLSTLLPEKFLAAPLSVPYRVALP